MQSPIPSNRTTLTARSPDQDCILTLTGVDMRMSHTLHTPQVSLPNDEGILLDLTESLWSVDEYRWIPGGLQLTLRRYPGDQPSLLVRLELESRSAHTDQWHGPMSSLLDHLETLYEAGHPTTKGE